MADGAESAADPEAKWRAIALLSVCQILALAVWFSASAVLPALRLEVALDDLQAALLASAVAVGFVVGTLISAILGLPDRFDTRRIFMTSVLVAAAANAGLPLIDPAGGTAVLLRFVTGTAMAGVYPVGMKMAATWARGDMGLLIGILVGALVVGTAMPHLLNVLGGVDWRLTLWLASALAVGSGLLIHRVRLGPRLAKAPPFQPGYILMAWRDKALRLANFGYFGHMWELYAMWAWIGVFMVESFRASGLDPAEAARWAGLATFAAIGLGGVGCWLGGAFADAYGRTTLTMLAMAVSGACALVAGFLFGAAPWLVTALVLVWGVAVVADSPQFSSSVMELAEPSHLGTMVTIQTSVGFLLTLITIHLVPPLVANLGWGVAFAMLAPGPFLGVIAMWRLRRHPDAVKLAGGRR